MKFRSYQINIKYDIDSHRKSSIANSVIRGQRTIKIQKITHFLIPKIVTLRRAHSSIVLMCHIFNENT